jgi:hypothetical protein
MKANAYYMHYTSLAYYVNMHFVKQKRPPVGGLSIPNGLAPWRFAGLVRGAGQVRRQSQRVLRREDARGGVDLLLTLLLALLLTALFAHVLLVMLAEAHAH